MATWLANRAVAFAGKGISGFASKGISSLAATSGSPSFRAAELVVNSDSYLIFWLCQMCFAGKAQIRFAGKAQICFASKCAPSICWQMLSQALPAKLPSELTADLLANYLSALSTITGKVPTMANDHGRWINDSQRSCVQTRQTCSAGNRPARVKARSPVARMAERREIKELKPIDEAINQDGERVTGP